MRWARSQFSAKTPLRRFPTFRSICELRPRDARGRLALGLAYFNSHNLEKAQQILVTVEDDPATLAGAHYYLGRIANQKGDFAEALRQLQRALQANPKYADAYAELGLVNLKRKEYPQAETALRKALELNADSYTANLNLMILYQRTGDPRTDEQAKRFEQVKNERADRAKEFLRTIEVRPRPHCPRHGRRHSLVADADGAWSGATTAKESYRGYLAPEGCSSSAADSRSR